MAGSLQGRAYLTQATDHLEFTPAVKTPELRASWVKTFTSRNLEKYKVDQDSDLYKVHLFLFHHDHKVKQQAIHVLYMMEHGKDPEQTGLTPLHHAAAYGYLEFIKAYIKTSNVDVNAQTYLRGRTALHFAVANGHDKVARFLINELHADINLQTKKGTTIVDLTVQQDDADLSFLLYLLSLRPEINTLNEDGKTALHIAVEKNNRNAAMILLALGGKLGSDSLSPYLMDDSIMYCSNASIKLGEMLDAFKSQNHHL